MPFKQLDLQRAIELTISRLAVAEEELVLNSIEGDVKSFILSDRIFVRYHERMVKIMMMNILYIEADRNYSRIFTKEKEYLFSVTLKNIEEKLPQPFLCASIAPTSRI